jgi:hypothetical protein
MPTTNPYPERAIASFLLVGGMGVALLFTGPPVASNSSQTPLIADQKPDDPTGRAGQTHPRIPAPAAAEDPGVVPGHDYVFSEAVVPRAAETPAVSTSAAPGPTQAVPAPVPAVPTPVVEPNTGLGVVVCPIVGNVLDVICSN